MKDTLAARHAQWQELQLLEPPFFIKNGVVPPLSEYKKKGQSNATKAGVGDVVQGVPGCTGQYVGRARVILDPTEPGDLEPGDVLIAPNTDPAWTPLFMSCGAVVVNVGAAISHAISAAPRSPRSASSDASASACAARRPELASCWGSLSTASCSFFVVFFVVVEIKMS